MEENLPNKPEQPGQEVPEEVQPGENITLSDAMAGVFTEPGPTFEAVKQSTRKNYWIVPIIILILISLVASYLVLHDDELYSEIRSRQMTAAKERMEKAVQEGKMTQEQMNENIDRINKGFNRSGPLFIVSSTVGPIVTIFLALFIQGLIFWGAVKLFKGTATYMNVLSVLGLASLIDSIQSIINTALSIFMGRLQVNIGPILLFSQDSLSRAMSLFISHFDLLNIWIFIVIGVGLAKVSNLKNSTTIPVVFVLWLVWVCVTSFTGLPFFGR
jgi:hypothetical protein